MAHARTVMVAAGVGGAAPVPLAWVPPTKADVASSSASSRGPNLSATDIDPALTQHYLSRTLASHSMDSGKGQQSS